MTIMIQTSWHQIGTRSDGAPLRAIGLYDNDKVIGRVVNVGDGCYRADFINCDGNPEEIVLPDYPTAIQRVVDEAVIRKRVMN
jgi:hypothetical protein